METNRLTQFKMVAATKNLREAADLLHITHAGLAKSLRVLEQELGVQLITRDGRGIKITEKGQTLLSNMEECLKSEERLRMRAMGLELTTQEQVKIGTFEVFSTYFAPSIVQKLSVGIHANFEELMPGKLEEAIVNGRVDYGITYIPVPKSELDFIRVTKIKMGIFGVKKFLQSEEPFKQWPFAVPLANISGTPNKVQGLDGWPDNRIPRNIVFSVSLMESAMALVRQGLCVAYLPDFVVERHNQLVKSEYLLHPLSSPLKSGQTQDVFAIKRKNREEMGNFRALCRALRELN